jgi:hypothetical protein
VAPPVRFVETLRRLVAAQDPEDRFLEPRHPQAPPRVFEQAAADALAPMVGVDIEGADFTGAGGVGVPRGQQGGEADDRATLDCDEGLRFAG